MTSTRAPHLPLPDVERERRLPQWTPMRAFEAQTYMVGLIADEYGWTAKDMLDPEVARFVNSVTLGHDVLRLVCKSALHEMRCIWEGNT